MTVSGGTLARVFCLVIAIVIITPTFYAHAVETESNRGQQAVGRQKNELKQVQSDNDTPSHAARIKIACSKVRTSISNRTASLQQASERRIGMIDKVYGNLTTFADNNHITIGDEDRQAVLMAHDAASDAIQRLADSEDALNCEDANVEQAALTLKLNIQAVNDTMRSYRQAVGDMLATVKAQALTGRTHE